MGTARACLRVLGVADEVDPFLYGPGVKELAPDLVVSCGDLPFEYLEYIVTLLNVPLAFVPGNHDPDLSRDSTPRLLAPPGTPLVMFPSAGTNTEPGPSGCINVDRQVKGVAGLRIAGLGGSSRYDDQGANQYTQDQMWRRALALELRCRMSPRRRHLDLLVTHAPPLGLGDGDDPAHRGFAAFHGLIRRLSPRYLLHGHTRVRDLPDRRVGPTTIISAVRRRIVEIPI